VFRARTYVRACEKPTRNRPPNIEVMDGTVDVVSEGHWGLFTP
jgi:hypothetical protein